MALLVLEPGYQQAYRLWNYADNVASVRLVYAEARAALASAARMGRLTSSSLEQTVEELERLYLEMDVIEVTDMVVRRASDLADRLSLRGYDAVHLAAAETLVDDGVVLVSGDRDLCRAAETLGLDVSRT